MQRDDALLFAAQRFFHVYLRRAPSCPNFLRSRRR